MWLTLAACVVNKARLEPPHDKTNKMIYAPSEDSDQPGHPPSLIRVFAVCSMSSWGPKVSSCRQQRLIRLGRCPGWSESWLSAQVILLVLSWGGSLMPVNYDYTVLSAMSDCQPGCLSVNWPSWQPFLKFDYLYSSGLVDSTGRKKPFWTQIKLKGKKDIYIYITVYSEFLWGK